MKKSLNLEFFGNIDASDANNFVSNNPNNSAISSANKESLPVPEMKWISEATQDRLLKPNSRNESYAKEGLNLKSAPDFQELQNQFHELQSSTKLKVDRLQQTLSKLESNHLNFAQEVSEKMAILIQKLNEQKKFDHKVQDIVDRHNNLLKGYEVRLNQMLKLIQQKESDYLEAQAALKETKIEISRLKRL